MSFGGAECSTGRNPLSALAKVDAKDTSLQRDRIGHAGQLPFDGGLRSMPQEMAAADKQMMENFFAQEQAAVAAGDPIALDAIRREIAQMQQAGPAMAPQMPGPQAHFHAPPPQVQQNWAAEFGPQTAAPEHAPGFSVAEFDGFTAVSSPAPAVQQRQFVRPLGYSMFGGLAARNMHQHQHHHGHQHMHQPPQVSGKGKEKMVELDDQNWEKQFAALELGEATEEEQAKAIERELDQVEGNAFSDFESVWKGIAAEQDENGLLDTNWLDELDSTKTWTPQDSMTTTLPNMGEYSFEKENPYAEMKNAFEEGKRLFESGGNLSLAALAFEAAVQQDPRHVEAWTLLGACQAQNEKETPAIRALETAVRLDEKNLSALMDLAVSYTNEGYDSSAYNTLERWVIAKYPQLAPEKPANSESERIFTRERVTDLFIKAAQLSPDGQVVDSDVQVGLGVLFYGAEEYDKAVDCFSVALQFDYDQRNKNHLLWNRLGATLANSGRPEEAINAYEKALEINPNFVRARYNLGVSCINIGCFEEAAQHLLGALSMHKVARDKANEQARDLGIDPSRILHNESTNLLDTLRRVFGQMGRRDLAEKVVAGMDVDIFRGEFDF